MDEKQKKAASDETVTMTKANLDTLVADAAKAGAKAAVDEMSAKQTNGLHGKLLGSGDAQPMARSQAKGADFARLCLALAANKGIPELAVAWAAKRFGDQMADPVCKALSASVATAGGFLVPEVLSGEIIDLLRPRTVVRASGVPTAPLVNGGLLINRHSSTSQAQYIGENQAAPKTEPTVGQIRLTARKLAAIIPISNDLIRYSPFGAEQFVVSDIVNSMATTEDAAFLRGNGLGNAPKGMRYWASPTSTQVIAAQGTVNISNCRGDLGKLELALMNANVPMIAPTWVMHPRTLTFLRNLTDTNGNLAFPEVNQSIAVANGQAMLRGFPVRTTTAVPANLGGGSNESEIYFYDASEGIIGEATGILIDASGDASYSDGSNTVSAFQNDQTVIRAIAQHDFAMRHDQAVAVLTGVTWGA